MLRFAFLSKEHSEQFEWSYSQFSPFICDAYTLDETHISMLRYRRKVL